MRARIRKLRKKSLNAKPYVTPERATLITEFYRHNLDRRASAPVERALAFAYYLRKKAICINEGELIVGERGPEPKAVPTYPEICCHSLEDLETLDKRGFNAQGSGIACIGCEELHEILGWIR